ncbi:MAG: lipocalin family protein [Prevotella sp.]|nr:lipocalin family protein [Prevotella sp.]
MSSRLWLLLILPLFIGCGTGDDDGARLAEQIVGTWYRGWAEGDVEIIGDVNFNPEDFSYHYFTFEGDGSYNGMVRDGSFSAIDTFGDTIYAGTYKCDNDNLRLEYTSSGQKQKIQARVLSFDEMNIRLEYKNADAETPVTVRLKLSATPTTKPSPMD